MTPLIEIARSIFDHALAECSVERAFERMLSTSTDVRGTRLIVGGRDEISLDSLSRVRIVSAGKAAAAMLTSLLSRLHLPPSCDIQGVLIAGARSPHLPGSIQFFPGGHPTPNEASFDGATAALSMIHELHCSSPNDALCLFLISGGASSMMELPLTPAISLADTIAFHRTLVHSGASIVEINCVRKHFSAVKGGRLALAAGNARKISLLVSDVPPAHLDALASGPTIGDPTTIAECREILELYKLLDRFPISVRRHFESPDLTESPKPGAFVSQSWKVLDSDELAAIAVARANSLGFYTTLDNTCDDWPYDAAGDYLLRRVRQLRRQHSRVCLISAGEVTVRVPDALPSESPHAGGRNQHLALYLATKLAPTDSSIAILSAGSDGIDGNSTAAGAVVNEHTIDARHPHSSALLALRDFNSFPWLSDAGATIVTGPTGHNLRDLRILLTDEGAR